MSESPDRRLPAARPVPSVPYASYLRVYEPLAAFPEPERAHWADYARRGAAPTAQDELRRSLTDLVRVPVVGVPAHESADAFTAEVDGVLLVCPWRTRLRGWLALQELVADFPGPVLDAALPPGERRRAAEEFAAWRERNPDARPWIRTGVWQVPLRWFVLVSDEEREYLPGERLRYRTPMVQARRRLARGLRTLREAEGYGGAGPGAGRGRELAGGVPPALDGRTGLRGTAARAAGRPAGGRPLGPGPRGGDRGAPGGRHVGGGGEVRGAGGALAGGAGEAVRQLGGSRRV
ncbi:hypothetical protein GCM10020254_45770 [Streptomyces goshikiensis]